MTTRNRFPILAVTGVLAALLFAPGSALAAIITQFDGQFSSGSTGTNTAISTAQPSQPYQAGTGQKIFYLSFGKVSSTQEPSTQWNNKDLNQLTVDVTNFTTTNSFGSVTAYANDDSSLLQIGFGTEGGAHADFTMANTAKITSNQVDHATIDLSVTLRDTSFANGDDLSAFQVGGGGTFTLDIDNIQITQPPTDGLVFFPVNPTKQVTVKWSVTANPAPVPEPSSAVSLLVGASLLGLCLRRRTKRA